LRAVTQKSLGNCVVNSALQLTLDVWNIKYLHLYAEQFAVQSLCHLRYFFFSEWVVTKSCYVNFARKFKGIGTGRSDSILEVQLWLYIPASDQWKTVLEPPHVRM